ncbi:MAG: AIR synthase related protein, partial [Nitrospiria bacterium]
AIVEPKSYSETLLTMLASPNFASKAWVYEQYDHMVQTNTVIAPGLGAAMIRLKGTEKALAMTTDGNSGYALLNPYFGGAIAVAEAARNLACIGAKPVGMTNCLNFGNPERPETMWSFGLAVEGMADACTRFEIPVVSGNVSLYNETLGLGIYPTPIVGMVGVIDTPDLIRRPLTPGFKAAGEKIVLIGDTREELGGSAYLKIIHSQERGYPPNLDFEKEKGVQMLVREAAQAGLLTAAHDCAEGGLTMTLAECCLLSPAHVGGKVTISPPAIRTDGFLFGESQSRIVVTVKPADFDTLQSRIEAQGLPYTVLGETGGTALEISIQDHPHPLIHLSLDAMNTSYKTGLSDYFKDRTGSE